MQPIDNLCPSVSSQLISLVTPFVFCGLCEREAPSVKDTFIRSAAKYGSN
jgi:hypothetical protein